MAFGFGGQFVPEAVEIDALASFHEPVHVRAAKIEMPQHRAFQDFVPGSNSGQGRVDDDPFADPVRILSGECVAHHVADIMGDKRGLLNVEFVQHRRRCRWPGFSCHSRLRIRRIAHPAQVRHDNRVIPDQHLGERCPHVAGVAKAVQQDDGRSFPAGTHIDRGAVGLDLLGPHFGRKFFDPCVRGLRCREQKSERDRSG